MGFVGCDQEFRLVVDDGSEMWGMIVINVSLFNEIFIIVKGEEFVGYWCFYVVDESEVIWKYYGVWSLIYKNYVSGQLLFKLCYVYVVLWGSKGLLMECEFDYCGEKNGQGICDLVGMKYCLLY